VKLFYVVYVRDHRLGPALATIRLLANPAAKWLPHISIQSSRVGGMPVEITGVATDFGSNRDIGALLVHAPRLEAIRYQPDFPGGSLHISICRGSIRHEVMRIIERYVTGGRHPHFIPLGLEVLDSHAREGNLAASAPFSDERVRAALGVSLTLAEVTEMSEHERLGHLHKAAYLLQRGST
jgi:hypothetical protein